MDHSGSVVYSHEGDPSWDVNQHLSSLQREGLSARNIYWRFANSPIPVIPFARSGWSRHETFSLL